MLHPCLHILALNTIDKALRSRSGTCITSLFRIVRHAPMRLLALYQTPFSAEFCVMSALLRASTNICRQTHTSLCAYRPHA